jgi:hypothetical protein
VIVADDAPPALGLADLRAIVYDGAELAQGTRIVDEGGLSHLARHGKKLFADAAGSQVYKVQLAFADGGAVRARCSCMAARSRPYCKHAAALLVAWARMADAFAVADAPPAGADDGRRKRVKQGKVSAAALMGQGVAQVTTLVRELAVAGAATMADGRAPQVRALGENLREHRLRRLSAKTIALADLLAGARDRFDESAYAELMADLLLTGRKLEKHLAGEPLDDRQVEELIGKTWTKKDRAPIAGLELLEIAFTSRATADDFVIRESRFVDLASGRHYSEKQIVPRMLWRRITPKLSHAGFVLAGAAGSQYPSYPPHRLDLEPGARVAVTGEHLARLRAVALPDVKAAVTALQEHRRDVFAPDALPVLVACDMMIADRGRLQLVDAAGAAIFLPEGDRLGDRLATALAGVTLVAAAGELWLDGALPTLTPMALHVEVPRGPATALELRRLPAASVDSGRRRAARAAELGVHWAATARAVGLSTAAIALGEVREELAALLYTGLPSVTARRVEPLVARLRDLGLGKPADTLAALAARPDPADRLDDLIKLHQVLGVALARLAGAVKLDRAQLTASPLFISIFVRKADVVLAPPVIAAQVVRGTVNRFEAAARYAAWYRTIPAAELLDRPYPTWADGSASPFVALAARDQPERATATAVRLLLGGERPAPGQWLATPRMALITAVRVLEAVAGDQALAALTAVVERHADPVIRALATAAVWRAGHGGVDPPPGHWRASIESAPLREERLLAISRALEHGDTGAIPALRLAYDADAHEDVRAAAAIALGRLGDADSLDTFVAALEGRGSDGDEAAIAARALGRLGDVRGIHALLEAYQSGWRPEIIAEALAAVGPAAIPELLALVEERPALLKRSTARTVLDALPAAALIEAIGDRLEELVGADVATVVARAAPLLQVVASRPEAARSVALRLLALHPTLADRGQPREARALARKAAALRDQEG